MKTKKLHKDKVNIITLGCSKNMVDSEVLSGQLIANEIDVVHENKKHDHNIVVVNTCGFIDKAKEESINTILNQVELKRRGKLDKVYVTGCLSERYKNNLETEIPEVDAFFGTMELPLLLNQLEADYKSELIGERMLATPQHYAYLKISEGCNRTCSFCAIPLMRGQHISKSIEQLVAEAEGLVKKRREGSNADCTRAYLLWIGYLQKKSTSRFTQSVGRCKRIGMDTTALCLSFKISIRDIRCNA